MGLIWRSGVIANTKNRSLASYMLVKLTPFCHNDLKWFMIAGLMHGPNLNEERR